MANKTSGNQGSSGEADSSAPRVSRKVIGKTSAPYERKAEEGGGEKKPATEGQPAEQGEKAEAAAGDAGKQDTGKAARKDSGARKDSRDAARAAEAPAAAAPAAAAAPEAASVPPASPPRPTPPPPSEFPPPPELDPTAEFAELLPPRYIQKWDPNTPAPPPAKAPPGDSRSFRRRTEAGEEFVLIYRAQTFLIRRAGKVGVLGTFTITDYPHVGAAAHAYAQQCSELSAAGFRDLR